MKVVLAYIIVVVLVQFCLTIGTLLVGFSVALCLAWLPARIRAPLAGTFAGVGGVATAVAFGYFAFRFILGPGSFGIGAFLASTLPLAVPILNDRKHARRLAAAEQELNKATLHEMARAFAAPITDSAQYSVVGYLLGLALAIIWFFTLHENV